MLRSGWFTKNGLVFFAVLLAATWIKHLEGVLIRAGAHYTHTELALFAVSTIGILALVILRWGPAGRRFVAGWVGATALAAILSSAFHWLQFSHTPEVPWLAEALAVAWLYFLVGFTIDGAAFLAMFAAAAWISNRYPNGRFGTFALAGLVASVASWIPFGIAYFAETWWPFRAADVATGVVAGVTFWLIARPTQGAPRPSV